MEALIKDLTYEQLEELLPLIRYRLDVERGILDKIKKEGSAISYEKYDIPDVLHFKFSVNLDLQSYDRGDPEENFSVCGLAEEQDDWLGYFEDDIDGLKYRKENVLCDSDWKAERDWDGPLDGTGTVDIYLYYKKIECPKNGSEFVIIDEQGGCTEIKVVDDKVFQVGEDDDNDNDGDEYYNKFFCKVSDWDGSKYAVVFYSDE